MYLPIDQMALKESLVGWLWPQLGYRVPFPPGLLELLLPKMPDEQLVESSDPGGRPIV